VALLSASKTAHIDNIVATAIRNFISIASVFGADLAF